MKTIRFKQVMVVCRWVFALGFLMCVLWSEQPLAQAQPSRPQVAGSGPVYEVRVESILTSATMGFVRRAIRTAEAANANALIVTLRTDGAVLRDIRVLANEIVEASVPVVVFVAPSGTSSGAPGAFLLSAAHIAAMAPGTSFGSPYPLAQVDQALSSQTQSIVSDSLADQLRRWNRDRGRGVAWIDQAVNSGIILTNEQAYSGQPPSIDIVAASDEQLLTFLDGRVVTLTNGVTVQLATLERARVRVAPTLAESLWIMLADPTVAFALLVIGALAIYLEFVAPGTTLFAGLGVILLIGAAIGLLALPVRPWALGLVVIAFIIIGLEFVVSSHGGLAIAGLVLLTIGSLNLIDPVQAPGAGVSTWAVAIMVAGTAAIALAGVFLAVRTRSRPVATGQDSLVGQLAEVRQRLDPEGLVFVEGARWRAVSEAGPVEQGEWVRIVAVRQLRLIVRPLEQDAG